MSNNKQSSIEWLEQELKKIPFVNVLEVFEQAKAMHKEEIGDAYLLGYGDHQTLDWHDLDEYYEQTYESNS